MMWSTLKTGVAITLSMLSLWSNLTIADDTEVFTAANVANTESAQVMIIFDNSGSMRTVVPRDPYDASITYQGGYPSNGTGEIDDDHEDINNLLSDGHPCQTRSGSDDVRCPGNYLNWFFQPDRTRMDVAKEAVTQLITDNPSLEFGLALFNFKNGGHIFQGLRERNSGETQTLLSAIDDLSPSTWTPLCETYYEVYRYFTGQSVDYGLEAGSRDTSQESDGLYTSPLNSCQNIYVIYMTDGQPSEDGGRDTEIETLTGRSCSEYDGNCLPILAGYLSNPGESGLDGNTFTGPQKAFTYTIGFDTDQQLLRDTADEGGGNCYTTVGTNTDPEAGCVAVDDIAGAFEGALGEILKRNSTFVSPSVAVNSFKKTESLDNAYYAMFRPTDNTRWLGNIKKLKIFKDNTVTPGCDENDNFTAGTVVDRGCDAAIETNGNRIAEGIGTYWGNGSDGRQVESGGLGAQLLATGARGTFYTNLTFSDEITEFEFMGPLDYIERDKFGLTGSEHYTSDNLINWIKGLDDDGNTRSWVLGDILHSQPVTLNYGDTDGDGTEYDHDNPNIRLAFGTNFGQLHFIEDKGNDVEENWSFFAGETSGNVPALYLDSDSTAHPYGIDGQISIIRLDYNDDGNIKYIDGDRMVLLFGMRRGGDSYYAIDVSNPDGTPILLWRKDSTDPGFAELGQSWSSPVPMIIPGYRRIETDTESGVTTTSIFYRYVVAFGAGYDSVNDDDRNGIQEVDTDGNSHTVRKLSQKGRGVFFVDAGSGELIKSFIPTDNVDLPNALHYEDSRLKWSVVAPPAPMDSNGDGLTDRVYFADTGGNVFRIDIGTAYLDEDEPTEESNVWSMIKLAELGADELDVRPAPDNSSDRRFMYQPELVRTIYRGVAYDAVVLGSGNRANPQSGSSSSTTSPSDRYYVIRDKNVFYNRFGTCEGCSTPPEVIQHDDFYDASSNLIQEGTGQQSASALNILDTSFGWYINLTVSGEKTTTVGDVYSGSLLFSTYSPTSAPGANACMPGIGSSRFYVVNLHIAAAIRDLDNDGDRQVDDRASLLSVMGMPGDAAIVSMGEGQSLCDLNSNFCDVDNPIGIHRSGWLEL
ncbi:pilus assembly protein [Endozoicomonas ascidiicola]|uniref:pilus assembly protein n=1 Tax=Endozoicomonas ascidiicola TaxID=1698521 RepID=UPI00082C82CD|nr:hypothetical protein [Endozoicomonas ascidiicola]